jgi:hypothetical protein
MSKIVIVQQQYTRDIEVEVSDEEYAVLVDTENANQDRLAKTQDAVMDRAEKASADPSFEYEYQGAYVTGPDDEELFDVG